MHEELVKRKFTADAALISAVFLKSRNWTLNELSFPVVDVTFLGTVPLRIRMTCDDWDERPPSIQILNTNGTPWVGQSRNAIFNASPHPHTGLYFICMRGSREYHTHPSHLTDRWETYRGQDGNNIPGILDQLSRAWRNSMGV